MRLFRTNPLSQTLSPILLAAGLLGCGETANVGPQPIDENAPIVLSEPGRLAQWAEANHVNLSTLAASRWGLPASRVNVIGPAGDDPDQYESGLENGYNQQWSHAYLYSSLGLWTWGDANENFDDCITGRLANQLEGAECKDGQSAKYHYDRGNQIEGDRFLGYATHYIEDVCQVLHASFPSTDMVTYHFAYEDWVKANWTAGHNFAATLAADNYYYPITDLQQAVRNAAWAASYYNSAGAGRKVWDNYRSSGYPTAAGTGNAELVNYTRQLLIRAARYATGAIKYTFDTYNQWGATY